MRLFLCAEPTDMRRSFDGLAMLVQNVVGQDPFSGHLFIFRNRLGSHVKILHWDRNGYAIWYKRLEKGTFRFPMGADARAEIEAAEMGLILEGIDLAGAKRRPRFIPQAATNA